MLMRTLLKRKTAIVIGVDPDCEDYLKRSAIYSPRRWAKRLGAWLLQTWIA